MLIARCSRRLLSVLFTRDLIERLRLTEARIGGMELTKANVLVVQDGLVHWLFKSLGTYQLVDGINRLFCS